MSKKSCRLHIASRYTKMDKTYWTYIMCWIDDPLDFLFSGNTYLKKERKNPNPLVGLIQIKIEIGSGSVIKIKRILNSQSCIKLRTPFGLILVFIYVILKV